MSHAGLMFPPAEVLLMSNSTMNGNGSPSPEALQQQQLPQALQNLHRILQSQLANVNPLQLQQLIQRQQHQQLIDAGRKQLEQMLQQMQEQLQLNILQQTHLGSSKSGGNALTLQQLQQQQTHILGQMQIIQQALMLGQGLDSGSKDQMLKDRHRHDSATFGSVGSSSEGSLKENRPDNNNTDHMSKNLNGRHRRSASPNLPRSAASSPSTPSNISGNEQVDKLFVHGHCQWPGCDASVTDFGRHIAVAHAIDDKTMAQTRVQLQIVNQLEFQLAKEKERLEAMMKHLGLEIKSGELKQGSTGSTVTPPAPSTTTLPTLTLASEAKLKSAPSPVSSMSHLDLLQSSIERGELGTKVSEETIRKSRGPTHPGISAQDFSAMFPNLPSSLASLMSAGLPSLTAGLASPSLARPPSHARAQQQQHQQLSHLSSETPIRPKPSRTPSNEMPPVKMRDASFSLPPGFDERRGRGDRGNPNLDPAMDIKQNQEFYRHNDVRPPYTYAALIRYAIQESPDQQLTLHEIYNWFTTTFAYFRRNAASWKNAVRHNLSLHKCFMRVENVKGAVWTVDDNEYYRRRPARGTSASASASPTLTPQTPSLIDQSFSSMFGASASTLLGKKSNFERLPFFNSALMQEGHHHNQFKQDNGLESPPASLENRSTPGSLDLSRSHKRMDSSPMYSNDSNDEADDDPPTMVPRTDLQARAASRDLEEEEEDEELDAKAVDELKMRSSRSHQKFLALQRKALERYELMKEHEFGARQEEADDDDDEDEDHLTEPDSKKMRVGSVGHDLAEDDVDHHRDDDDMEDLKVDKD